MNWFQQNRWLGTFLIVFAIGALAAGYFWHSASSHAEDALGRFKSAAGEKNRLQSLDPFPSEGNYRKMKLHLENYGAALDRMKDELRARVLPAPPLAPNEFQSRLRQSIVAVTEKARANRVKLPDNFALGFEAYTSSLPNTAAAPLLGQELSQIELLLNFLLEAHVDGISKFVRVLLPEEGSPAATPAATQGKKAATVTPAGPKLIERSVVDFTFASAPSAARRVLNQIASAEHQFYIIRLLHVRNEKDKGPPRVQVPENAIGAAGTPVPATPGAKPAGNAALNFIVGNEHIETSMRVELIRFTF